MCGTLTNSTDTQDDVDEDEDEDEDEEEVEEEGLGDGEIEGNVEIDNRLSNYQIQKRYKPPNKNKMKKEEKDVCR